MLQSWFQGNAMVIYFAYGLVFFVMGGAVALTARNFRNSKLVLAGGLPYLAGFGVLLGLGEWGVVFVPLQAPYLPQAGLALLALLQTSIVALAYSCLLGFGLALNLSRRQLALLALVPALAWPLAFAVSGLTLELSPAFTLWRKAAHFWAAWGLGLPGALLAARGLLRQHQEVARYYPHTSRRLLIAAGTFLLSAPLGTWAIPSSPVDIVGPLTVRVIGWLPVQVLLAAGGLVLTGSLLGGLEIFRLESSRRVERAERRQTVLEERYRIGKELKDGVIQDLFATGMLVEAAVLDLSASDHSDPIRTLTAASAQLRETMSRLRTYIMDLEPIDWDVPDLSVGLHRLVDEFQANTLLPVRLEVPPGLTVPAGQAREIYTVVYEGLVNIREHAQASHVELLVRRQESALILTLRDNGIGLSPEQPWGMGLERMHRRAESACGHLTVTAAPGAGTLMRLELQSDSPMASPP